MQLQPSAEDQAIADSIAAFARAKLLPRAQHIDENSEFVTEHLPALGEIGVMGMNLPAEWGGAGISSVALYLAVEALAGACGSTASMVTAHFLATDAILIGADAEQRRRFLPDAAAGRALGAFALTEPHAGSNPADIRLQAVREGQGYRLTGVKHFISNAAHAAIIVVFAKTDPGAGARGISAIVVEPRRGGVGFSLPERTMGLRGGHIFEVTFDCLVPEENRLGVEGIGTSSPHRCSKEAKPSARRASA